MSNSYDITHRPVATLASGHEVHLTVHTVQGDQPGPTLLLFGGIHGDEAMGVEGVRRILAAIRETQLRGRVMAVPVCNPLAYETMTRHTIQDGLNLNRIFPGDPKGSITEQIAAALAELQEPADYFIDYHSSGLYSTVDYAYLHQPARHIAQAYGTSLLYHHDPYPGSSTELALGRGIPALVSELGGGGQSTTEYLHKATDGTLNVLRALEMIPGAMQTNKGEQTVLTELTTLRPKNGGAIISNYPPGHLGTSVPKGTVLGTVLGTVVNPYTFAILEEFTAPFDPTVLVLTREEYTRNNPGDYGFMVGNGATATTAKALFGDT